MQKDSEAHVPKAKKRNFEEDLLCVNVFPAQHLSPFKQY